MQPDVASASVSPLKVRAVLGKRRIRLPQDRFRVVAKSGRLSHVLRSCCTEGRYHLT